MPYLAYTKYEDGSVESELVHYANNFSGHGNLMEVTEKMLNDYSAHVYAGLTSGWEATDYAHIDQSTVKAGIYVAAESCTDPLANEYDNLVADSFKDWLIENALPGHITYIGDENAEIGIGTQDFPIGHAVYRCKVDEMELSGSSEPGEESGFLLSIDRYTVDPKDGTFIKVRHYKEGLSFASLNDAWKYWSDFCGERESDQMNNLMVFMDRLSIDGVVHELLVEQYEDDHIIRCISIVKVLDGEEKTVCGVVGDIFDPNEALAMWENWLDDLFPAEQFTSTNRFNELEIKGDQGDEQEQESLTDDLPGSSAWPKTCSFTLTIEDKQYSCLATRKSRGGDQITVTFFDLEGVMTEKVLKITKDKPASGEVLEGMTDTWIRSGFGGS